MFTNNMAGRHEDSAVFCARNSLVGGINDVSLAILTTRLFKKGSPRVEFVEKGTDRVPAFCS